MLFKNSNRALIGRSVVGLLGIGLLLNACTPKETLPNTLTNQEKEEGWALLFDGVSTKGWHIYNQGDTLSKWSAHNGELWCNPKEEKGIFGDLVTDDRYENFDLRYEWKISKGGNSGVMIDVQESPQYGTDFMTAPEMQLLDNANAEERHKTNPLHWAGCLYDVLGKGNNSKPKPFGEWNQSRIIQQDGKVTFWLNGFITAEADLKSQTWKNAVAKSNLGKFPAFGKMHSGKIALQNHTDEVAFRNMKIKKLYP
ncbi:MAG: DUF1080 domain-containing protein [Siphonobacter sp.]